MSRAGRAIILLTAFVLAACGAGSKRTIEPQDPDLVAAGNSLYAASCASCHGGDLRGTDQGPSHLSAVYEPNHHGDVAFEFAVRFGVPQHHWRFGPMPPVEGLTDENVESIVAFIREQQRIEGFESYPP